MLKSKNRKESKRNLKLKGTQDLVKNKKAMNDLEDKLIRNGNKNLNNLNFKNNSPKNINSGEKCDNSCVNTKSNSKGSDNQVKRRNPNPKPAMSYDALLSLASEKAKTEKKSLVDELQEEIKEKKQMRPMTQKEKDRLKEEQYYRQRAQKGMAKLPDPETIKKNKSLDSNKETNTKKDFDQNSKYGKNKLIAKTVVVSNTQQNANTNHKNIKPNDNSNRLPTERSSRPSSQVMARQDPKRVGHSSGSNKSEILNKMNNRLNMRDKDYNERYLSASKEKQRMSGGQKTL